MEQDGKLCLQQCRRAFSKREARLWRMNRLCKDGRGEGTEPELEGELHLRCG